MVIGMVGSCSLECHWIIIILSVWRMWLEPLGSLIIGIKQIILLSDPLFESLSWIMLWFHALLFSGTFQIGEELLYLGLLVASFLLENLPMP